MRHGGKSGCYFQRGIRRWTSKVDNIRGTSAVKWLNRDKIMEIRWFDSSKDFVSKRILQSNCSLILGQRKDRREGVIYRSLGALTTARSREFWMSSRRFS